MYTVYVVYIQCTVYCIHVYCIRSCTVMICLNMFHEGQLLALGDYILLLSLALSHRIPQNIQRNLSFLIGPITNVVLMAALG